jgi:hypothetical protein
MFKAEEELLRKVWEIVDVISPPDPDDAMMEQMYRQIILAISDTGEIDDDELDWAVGARKSTEIDPADNNR